MAAAASVAVLMLATSPSNAQLRRNFVPLVYYDPYGYSPWMYPYSYAYNPFYYGGYPYRGGNQIYIYNPPASNYTPPNSEEVPPMVRPEPRPRIQEFYSKQKAADKPADASNSGKTVEKVGSPSPLPARLEVHLPDNAELWVDGVKTSQSGATREFVSPDLPPGQQYFYELRATWHDQGRQVTETRRVSFRASEKVDVDFGASNKVGPKEERLPSPKPGKQ
jgi:uncharacterized protein (TIGR03000 family)